MDADDVFGDRIARPEPDWDLGLIERAINGVELPNYTGAPDSGA